MRVSRLRQTGVVVEATPEEGGAGHASFSNLNHSAYEADKDKVRELANTIAERLIERVQGAFGPFDADSD